MPILNRPVRLLLRIFAGYINRWVIRYFQFYCQQFGWSEKEVRTVCKAAIILVNALFRALMEGIMGRKGPGHPHPNSAPCANAQ